MSWAPCSVGRAAAQILKPEFYVPDDAVSAIARSGNQIYIGGEFTRVGPATGGGVPFDIVTGDRLSSFPKVAGDVYAIVPDGLGGWYLAGQFTAVGGLPRANIAHVLADYSVSAWDASADGPVVALTVNGTTVYAAGSFTTIGGESRNFLAALDASTGLATSWDPDPDNWVLALSISGSTIYVGGLFANVAGQSRGYLAAIDAATGLATPWDPASDSIISGLAVDGSLIYACGYFTNVGGQTRRSIAALALDTGMATSWNPDANDWVGSVVPSGSTVYALGAFTSIGGQVRNSLAALDAATGLATAWDPNATTDLGALGVNALALSGSTIYVGGNFKSIGGQARSYLAALDATTGQAKNWDPHPNSSVFFLTASGSTVYAGGDFTSIGGEVRNSLAALDATTGQITPWDPAPDFQYLGSGWIHSFATDGSTIYIAGTFAAIGGEARNYLAALDPATGLATSWDPNPNGAVTHLVISGSTIYALGSFTSIGGQPRNGIAALDLTTGIATAWDPSPIGAVRALAIDGPTIYVGGSFVSIGGQSRNYLAALNASTGQATTWNPNPNGGVGVLTLSGNTVYACGGFTYIGGQSRNYIAAIDAVTGQATAWDPNSNDGVYGLGVIGSRVYVTGSFTNIGGQPRNTIAAIDATTGLANDWDPNPIGGWLQALPIEVSGTAVYVGGEFHSIANHPQSYFAVFDEVPTAISMALLAAEAEVGRVRLEWYVPMEGMIAASLLRRTAWDDWALLGHPERDSSGHISYDDDTVEAGVKYGYRLVVRDAFGEETVSEIWVQVPEGEAAPRALRLDAARPNPSSGRVALRYGLPRAGRVQLRIFDLQGRQVAVVTDRAETLGWRTVEWNGRDRVGRAVASGPYFARLESAGEVSTRKIVIAR